MSSRAILRILHEIDHSPPEKIIWFLAPTISLCTQQHALLEEQIPAVQIRFLSGNDAMDKWRDKGLWDAILKNVRIVVSTHQVLLDALSNAFVSMDTLSLLIFDEAHNCVKAHPGSRIMRDFYRGRKDLGLPVPHILGLSASPIMNSKLQSLEKIEETLDSICRTPVKCKRELLENVNLPEMCQVFYTDKGHEFDMKRGTASLASLNAAFLNLDINKDPYIRRLRLEGTPRSKRALQKALQRRDTWCFKQMKTFCQTSVVVYHELGAWAADYFIAKVVTRLGRLIKENSSYLFTWSSEEKIYLSEVLKSVDISAVDNENSLEVSLVSDKVSQFIKTLPHDGDSTIIAFVQQRATVIVLARLLSLHPLTRSKLRVGTMVGMSTFTRNGTNICDLVDIDEQRDTLAKLRAKELDMVIATSVLEEGIDVPACNMVICFDQPANLKSFVQRRGRARKTKSKLILMQSSQSNKLDQWQELEVQMKEKYADDMRIVEIENFEEHDRLEFRVKSTGCVSPAIIHTPIRSNYTNMPHRALLSLDNAVPHLYHFCAVLPSSQYCDRRPEFIESEDEPMRVLLPLCIDKAVREASARKIWSSEKNAKKDAAFQAYLSLYKHGLVDDHLMPLLRHDAIAEEFAGDVEKRPAVVDVSTQVDPWIRVAMALNSREKGQPVWKSIVTVEDTNNQILSSVEIMLPFAVPGISLLHLYWDDDTEMRVTVKPSMLEDRAADETLLQAQEYTRAALEAAFGWRFAIEQKAFVAPFISLHDYNIISGPQAHERISGTDIPMGGQSPFYLVREGRESNKPYIFEEYLDQKPPIHLVRYPGNGYENWPTDKPHVALSSLTRRTDFLHKAGPSSQASSKKQYSHVLPITKCIFDKLPFRSVQLAMFIPAITHRLGVHMVAEILCQTILESVHFTDHSLVAAAISASSASEESNYQRLEFLGDSILKTCTSLQLLGEFPLWHEGYLSIKKDRMVANSRLARAALSCGLDKFILTKCFTGRKWRPMYLQEVLSSSTVGSETREMSTKVLADVVEALMGAATVEGGAPKALACMRVFLPDINWLSLEERREQIFRRAEVNVKLPLPLEPLEEMVGYNFEKKSLLIEAMTHASYNIGLGSLERLEFLGDSILDHIVVTIIYHQAVELSHIDMHYLRTALVNADFLAFLCMEWATTQDAGDVLEDSTTYTFRPATSTIHLPLWKFMRHTSQEISRAQQKACVHHSTLRDDIYAAVGRGSHYPWALFSRIQAPKFFSDVVESLLGAVYVDSGSLKTCEGVLERIGLLPYLRRILADGVHVIHPKEELGILADKEEVKYVIQLEECTADVAVYMCEVLVGNRPVAVVKGGLNREEIKTMAAEAAVKILKTQQPKMCADGEEERGSTNEGANYDQSDMTNAMDVTP